MMTVEKSSAGKTVEIKILVASLAINLSPCHISTMVIHREDSTTAHELDHESNRRVLAPDYHRNGANGIELSNIDKPGAIK
jgi:hypothetical protein